MSDVTDLKWTRAMKAAIARGDDQEVKALRGSILLLLSMAANSDLSDGEFDRAYDDLFRQHGIDGDPPPDARNGWRRAAGLMLMQ